MSRLDENLGGVGFDNLIADSYPPTDVFSVQLTAGQGILERGTLLARKDDGTMEMIATATTGKANAVLAEPVDTGAPAAETQADGDGETATTDPGQRPRRPSRSSRGSSGRTLRSAA